MTFFKSRDEIPKLPKAPSLFDLPTIDDKRGIIPELPSFPSKNDIQERFNQQMVKSAINESPGEKEVDDYTPGIPSKEEVVSHEEYEEKHHYPVEQKKPITQNKETIYIKIDKFNSAQKAILDIQSKVSELSKAIDELKKAKTKEIEELNGWDEEMKNINLRLSRIDKGIFGEV